MSAGEDLFKQVMRRWASAVTIVTTRVGDQVRGLTVSGFAGISLDPPLVMISVGHNQNSHTWISDGGCFAVNFLRADQRVLSDRFAGRAGRDCGSVRGGRASIRNQRRTGLGRMPGLVRLPRGSRARRRRSYTFHRRSIGRRSGERRVSAGLLRRSLSPTGRRETRCMRRVDRQCRDGARMTVNAGRQPRDSQNT